jgi:hypothetical protein
MVHAGIRGTSNTIRIYAVRMAVGVATIVLVSASVALLTPSPASAKAEFAAQTGLPCGQCHTNPAGGGKLKSFGQKFKDNGYKLKK